MQNHADMNAAKREQHPFMVLVDPAKAKRTTRINSGNVLTLSKLAFIAEHYDMQELRDFLDDYADYSMSIDGLRGQELVDAMKGREQRLTLATPVNSPGGAPSGPVER